MKFYMVIETANIDEIEKLVIKKILQHYPFMKWKSIAAMTGQSERNLYRKLKKYGIDVPPRKNQWRELLLDEIKKDKNH